MDGLSSSSGLQTLDSTAIILHPQHTQARYPQHAVNSQP